MTVISPSTTPLITAGSQYLAGQIIGGLMTFPVATGAGRLESISVTCKSAQTTGLKIYLFDTNPAATTWTDKTVPAIKPADAGSVRGEFTLTADSGLGSDTIWNKDGIGFEFVGQ